MSTKDAIKQWEHEFLRREGRRPTPKDVQMHPQILELYKEYQKKSRWNRQSTVETAGPSNNDATVDQTAEQSIEEELATPRKSVREIQPTPQLQGRVLGLFDMQLPSTPEKRTPQKQILVETPLSRRTPSYLSQRANLIVDESPLFLRKTAKSISQVILEAENKEDLQFNELELEIMREAELEKERRVSKEQESGNIANVNSANENDTVADPSKGPRVSKKRTQKRTTRRAVLRPVSESDARLKSTRVHENYKRLKIHKPKRARR